MREELHKYLDGELEADALPPELRPEAEAWRALLEDVRGEGSEVAPVGLETRVLEEIGRMGEKRGSALARALAWWARPQSVSVPPAAGLLAAAVLAAILLLPARETAPESGVPTVGAAGSEEVVYVQFLLRAPDASQVALAGDFTDWLPEFELEDANGDGVWSVRVPVRPGVHEYMFVVDGDRWMTDPHARRYEDDGYGQRNAVLAVASPASGP